MADENGKLMIYLKKKEWKQNAFDNTIGKSKNKSLTELKKDRELYGWMCGPVSSTSKLFNEMIISLNEGTIEALDLLIQKKSI